MKELGVKYLFILSILFSFSVPSFAGPAPGTRELFSSKKAVKDDSPGCRSVKRAKEKKGGYKLESQKGNKFKGYYCYRCKKGAKKLSEETLTSQVVWKHNKGGKNLNDNITVSHVKCAAKPEKEKKVKKIKCYYCKDGKVKKHSGRYKTCDELKTDKKLEIELFAKRKDARKACKGKDGKKKKLTCYYCSRRGKIKQKKFRNIKTCSDKNKNKRKYYESKEDKEILSCGKNDEGSEAEHHCYGCYQDADGNLGVKKVAVDNKRCGKAKVVSDIKGLILAGSKKLHKREKQAKKLCLAPMKCYLCDPSTKKVRSFDIKPEWRKSKDLRTKKCENFGDKRGILSRIFKKSVYKRVFGRNNRNLLGKVKKGEFKNFEDMFIFSTAEQAKKSPMCDPNIGQDEDKGDDGKDEDKEDDNRLDPRVDINIIDKRTTCVDIFGAGYNPKGITGKTLIDMHKNKCLAFTKDGKKAEWMWDLESKQIAMCQWGSLECKFDLKNYKYCKKLTKPQYDENKKFCSDKGGKFFEAPDGSCKCTKQVSTQNFIPYEMLMTQKWEEMTELLGFSNCKETIIKVLQRFYSSINKGNLSVEESSKSKSELVFKKNACDYNVTQHVMGETRLSASSYTKGTNTKYDKGQYPTGKTNTLIDIDLPNK